MDNQKIGRELNWNSSINPSEALVELENKLSTFYSLNPNYYSDIDFTADNWQNESEKGYLRIVELAKTKNEICEIGCGKANILKHYPDLSKKYTGLDFSNKVLHANAKKYPESNFIPIVKPNEFPVGDENYDLVFSVFVLEHVVYPATFLSECKRILKPGGTLVILCPDFLGRGRMTSQRAGFSAGNSSEKIKKGKLLDGIITLFDNRIRIPFTSWKYRRQALKAPLFLINLSPIVFQDEFQPDVDAVYLTHKNEICEYLKDEFTLEKNDSKMESYLFEKKLIFLQLNKNKK